MDDIIILAQNKNFLFKLLTIKKIFNFFYLLILLLIFGQILNLLKKMYIDVLK